LADGDLIQTNKRRIALLEKMAEELYREWFVRMRFPGHQSTKFFGNSPFFVFYTLKNMGLEKINSGAPLCQCE